MSRILRTAPATEIPPFAYRIICTIWREPSGTWLRNPMIRIYLLSRSVGRSHDHVCQKSNNGVVLGNFGHSKALERPCGGKFWQGFQTQRAENLPRLSPIFRHQNIPSRPMPVSVSSTSCIFTCTIFTSSIQPVSYSRSVVPT